MSSKKSVQSAAMEKEKDAEHKKTLYVSDLDGTLLRSGQFTSDYTNRVINSLTEKGIKFSYATARSLVTAKKVTKGLHARIPLIVYNGAFVMDNETEEILIANYFDESVREVFEDLLYHEVYPIVYSYIDGTEKFSFLPDKCSKGAREFLETRKGDRRSNPVSTSEQLISGNCFYITCIDDPQKLEPLYEKYKDSYHAVYQKDIYSGEQWLEIMPQEASKSNAALQLKKLLQCERMTVFGDGRNDIDLFEAADECYAVENAVDELKAAATGVIGSNDEDAVAEWLETMAVKK